MRKFTRYEDYLLEKANMYKYPRLEDRNKMLCNAISVVKHNIENAKMEMCAEYKNGYSFLINAAIASSSTYVVYKDGHAPEWVHMSQIDICLKSPVIRIIEGKELKKFTDYLN